MVYSLIDMYLKQNPNEKRSQKELDHLDKINKFKQDRVILKQKAFQSDGSASSDEEVKAPVKAPKAAPSKAVPNQTTARGRPPLTAQMQCKQCPRMMDGYRCPPGQIHIQCNNCNGYMPDRNPSQKCATCTRAFCNLY